MTEELCGRESVWMKIVNTLVRSRVKVSLDHPICECLVWTANMPLLVYRPVNQSPYPLSLCNTILFLLLSMIRIAAMTEPGVASSDPTQLQSTAVLSASPSTSSSSGGRGPKEMVRLMPSFESVIRGIPIPAPSASSSSHGEHSHILPNFPPAGSNEYYQNEGEADSSRSDDDSDDPGEPVWVLQGRKWWTTGACDPRCACCIFVALTGGPSDPPHRRHSLFLFPMNSPGVSVLRPLYVMGYDDAPHGHAEVLFESVRVKESDLLGGLGKGFEVAQSRLGPGRLHHCSRLVGHGERAIEEILRRGMERKAFGKCLLDLGGNSEKLARCRIVLRLAQLSVVEAAVELDKSNGHAARLPDTALQVRAAKCSASDVGHEIDASLCVSPKSCLA